MTILDISTARHIRASDLQDAARYRYLRDRAIVSTDGIVFQFPPDFHLAAMLTDTPFSSLIDQAIARDQKQALAENREQC